MSVERISKKERVSAGNMYCSFCKDIHGIKVDAVYRKSGPSTKYSYACKSHVDKLSADERPSEGRMTEADYQTWARV